MFEVISDIMAQWYVMINTFIIKVNFYNAKKMNYALMFIISNHYGKIDLSSLTQLEECNDMFKLISDILAEWYVMVNTFIITITINFYNAQKMNWALMLIMSNHCGRIILSSFIQFN